MALNDNIKKFREEKNLTQQQLADKLYVSRQTVCRWENGSRCPDLITAKKLALELVNNPVPVSLLSGDRKPQIRFLGNHHSGSGNLYHKSFRM